MLVAQRRRRLTQPSLPAWLQGKAVGEWTQLSGTAIQTYVQNTALYDSLRTYHNGTMYTAYSGMAVRQSSAELLLGASGGGAGGWAGSDIIGLSLLDDTPGWVTHVAPAPPECVWPAGVPTNQTFSVNVGASTLTVSDVKNGFQNNENFTFPAVGTPPAPLATGTTYYVVNASGYAPVTFQVSATQGGSPITLTDAGNASARILWNRTSHALTKNGKPNARHAYNQPHYLAQTDEFVLLGSRNVWETDSGVSPYCFPWAYGAADWGSHTLYPSIYSTPTPQWDGGWQCQDAATGTIYYGISNVMCKRQADGTVTQFSYSPTQSARRDKAVAMFDAVRGTIIWHGEVGASYEWWEITTAGVRTVLSLTGPAAGAITNNEGSGLTQDAVTGDYYLHQNDGKLHRITWSGGDLYAEEVATTGSAPPSGDANSNGGGILTRFRYINSLGGIALITRATAGVYFVRTH